VFIVIVENARMEGGRERAEEPGETLVSRFASEN